MRNYLKDLNSNSRCFREEAERLRDKLRSEAKVDARGLLRWKSNGSVPPADVVEFAYRLDMGIDVERCAKARDEELQVFLADYHRRDHTPSGEELAEMRAAFGPGAVVVNIITGQRTRC